MWVVQVRDLERCNDLGCTRLTIDPCPDCWVPTSPSYVFMLTSLMCLSTSRKYEFSTNQVREAVNKKKFIRKGLSLSRGWEGSAEIWCPFLKIRVFGGLQLHMTSEIDAIQLLITFDTNWHNKNGTHFVNPIPCPLIHHWIKLYLQWIIVDLHREGLNK